MADGQLEFMVLWYILYLETSWERFKQLLVGGTLRFFVPS